MSTPTPSPPTTQQPVKDVGVQTTTPAESNESGVGTALADLTKRVQALEKGDKGFWKRVVVLVGVLGGLIALPRGIKDLQALLFPRPKIEFSWQPTVNLAYDNKNNTLKLIYRLAISNSEGTAEDRIQSASVDFKVAGQETLPIGAPNYGFQVNQQDVGSSLTLGRGEYKDNVVFYITLRKAFSDYALKNPGDRETDVYFTLQSKFRPNEAYPRDVTRFCLHKMDSDAFETVRNGGMWSVATTSCD